MFFRSQRALILAAFLLVIGGFELVKGEYYKEVANREATVVGVITRVYHGRGSIYDYKFDLNGFSLVDDSDACRTALTPRGCVKGAAVLVYYDRNDSGETLLEEFAEAGRGKMFLGAWMAGCGLLLIGLYFVFKKLLKSPDESAETDYDTPVSEPEDIHVVPEN
ncbi:MAG: hypothetical protein ACLGSD_16205 [Acidobacteriota bacterium]